MPAIDTSSEEKSSHIGQNKYEGDTSYERAEVVIHVTACVYHVIMEKARKLSRKRYLRDHTVDIPSRTRSRYRQSTPCDSDSGESASEDLTSSHDRSTDYQSLTSEASTSAGIIVVNMLMDTGAPP